MNAAALTAAMTPRSALAPTGAPHRTGDDPGRVHTAPDARLASTRGATLARRPPVADPTVDLTGGIAITMAADPIPAPRPGVSRGGADRSALPSRPSIPDCS